MAVGAAVALATATLLGVGDIGLDGRVGELARRKGAGYPSRGVRGLMRADIVLGNLEGPVSARGERREKKEWSFRAAPGALAIVKSAGLTALTVANNHAFDYGPLAFADTIREAEEAGLVVIGGGRDLAEAETVKVVEAHGLRVGLLGMTSTYPKEAWAGPGKAGVLHSDLDRLAALVREAKKSCDVLVVSFHGGVELSPEPNETQKEVMRLAADSGADLVLGHHPHVLQPVELRGGTPLVYSLGNFLFSSPAPAARVTAAARAVFTKKGLSRLEFVPLAANRGEPAAASPEQAAAVRAALDAWGAFEARPDLLGMAP